MEAGFTPVGAKDYEQRMHNLKLILQAAKENDVAVMLTIGAGGAAMPLNRGRTFLNDDNSMKDKGKFDLAWLPDQDEEFQKWINIVSKQQRRHHLLNDSRHRPNRFKILFYELKS